MTNEQELLQEFAKWWAREMRPPIAEGAAREAFLYARTTAKDWFSLETAPQDGTIILLLCDEGSISGHWDKVEGWVSEFMDGEEYLPIELAPYLWQHAPKIPEGNLEVIKIEDKIKFNTHKELLGKYTNDDLLSDIYSLLGAYKEQEKLLKKNESP